jgi:hypothetical protein
MNEGGEECKLFVGKPEVGRPLGKPSHRWMDRREEVFWG